jgi:hypothetical protein
MAYATIVGCATPHTSIDKQPEMLSRWIRFTVTALLHNFLEGGLVTGGTFRMLLEMHETLQVTHARPSTPSYGRYSEGL